MKKTPIVVIIIVTITILIYTSCKKDYHCACTFNNAVIFNTDLGNQTKKGAQDQCNEYDSTVVGEVWNCKIY